MWSLLYFVNYSFPDLIVEAFYWTNYASVFHEVSYKSTESLFILYNRNRNTTTHIIDFLANLTMKQQVEKDDFFRFVLFLFLLLC